MTTEKLLTAIEIEMGYQDIKWGPNRQQSLPGYIAVMENEIAEAKLAWAKNLTGLRSTPLEEILQVVTVGYRCLLQYGVLGTARATNDITEMEMRDERIARATRNNTENR